MIVRILGEGQFRVSDELTDELNVVDSELETAVEAEDQAAFERALNQLLDAVRTRAEPVPAERLEASDLILPAAGSSMDEVRKLLSDDGLIPG